MPSNLSTNLPLEASADAARRAGEPDPKPARRLRTRAPEATDPDSDHDRDLVAPASAAKVAPNGELTVGERDDAPPGQEPPVVVRPADEPYVARAVETAMKWDDDPFGRLEKDASAPQQAYEVVALSRDAIRYTRDGATPPLVALRRSSTALRLWLALCYRADRSGSTGVIPLFVPVALAPIVGLRARDAVDDPTRYKQAAQRVRNDLRKLADLDLLEIEETGDRWKVRMLRTDGSGRAWRSESSSGNYIRVPMGLARHGWLSVLSTRAVYVTVLLLDEWALQNQRWPVQMSRKRLDARYGISPDMFLGGLADLRRWDLALYEGRKLKSLGGGPSDFRTTSAWTLDVDMFQTYTPLGPVPRRLWPKFQVEASTPRAAAHRLASVEPGKTAERTAREALRYGKELHEIGQRPAL